MPRRKITRLTDSPEFEKVYRRGSAFRGKFFAMHTFPNELGTVRLGLSVSKKVGNAVERNKVRRRLREVFSSSLQEIQGDFDLVISARPASAGASLEDLKEEFLRGVRKLGPDRS